MTASPPDPAAEDGLIPLSALQHYVFCARQCALIHVEQIWAEDGATAQGRLLHERVDAGGAQTRPGARTERNVALRSWALGVVGRADVVEWMGQPSRPVPVEYKRGKPKAHRADEIQLCAQAICLEEMYAVAIPEGALFYGETRRRQRVAFDPALRVLTAQTAQAAQAMIAAGHTPPPVYMAGCRACSLQQACQPKRLQRPPAIAGWLADQFAG
jgi:CRISPR-associated exonuclease Cas4